MSGSGKMAIDFVDATCSGQEMIVRSTSMAQRAWAVVGAARLWPTAEAVINARVKA